jgi:hypothetical protein
VERLALVAKPNVSGRAAAVPLQALAAITGGCRTGLSATAAEALMMVRDSAAIAQRKHAVVIVISLLMMLW